MLSFCTNGGRLGEAINFLYGIFKFCKINKIPYTDIIVPLNYRNKVFIKNEKSIFVYKENIEMFQNIKYIFKDVNESYFNSFYEIDLQHKTDIAQMKNFYYYNNIEKDRNIIFKDWWSLDRYWRKKDPFFDIELLNYICRPISLVKRLKKQYRKFFKKDTIGIHVRRGDYKAISDKNILKDEFLDISDNIYNHKKLYTEEDIDKIIKTYALKYNILIFSDDINWCIEKFSMYKNVYFPHGKPYEDMILMSLCDNVIVNQGSFFSLIPYILSKGYKNA